MLPYITDAVVRQYSWQIMFTVGQGLGTLRPLILLSPQPTWDLAEGVRSGRIPKVFHESEDPDRLVPLVWKPQDYMVVVTGDPARNSIYVFAHNGVLGYPVAKKINKPST